jgi:hypothetical protein
LLGDIADTNTIWAAIKTAEKTVTEKNRVDNREIQPKTVPTTQIIIGALPNLTQ